MMSSENSFAQMSYQNYEAMMHLDKYSDLLANVGDKMKKDSTHKSKPVQDNMEFVLNDNQKIETNSKFDDLDQVHSNPKSSSSSVNCNLFLTRSSDSRSGSINLRCSTS
jgi:hypothetical protein